MKQRCPCLSRRIEGLTPVYSRERNPKFYLGGSIYPPADRHHYRSSGHRLDPRKPSPKSFRLYHAKTRLLRKTLAKASNCSREKKGAW